jgi:phosphoserine phosphatase RsbU/P
MAGATRDTLDWHRELRVVVDLMRELSRMSDPQAAAGMYGRRLRETGLVPSDEWVSVSRRGLERPWYRITRSTTWKEEINPWKQKDLLPLFDRGLLGELVYGDEPVIIDDLPSRLRADDPAYEYLNGFELLATLPQYENGVALNLLVVLLRHRTRFPVHRLPMMVWQANLWGRSVMNFALREELKSAYDALDGELQAVGQIQRSLLPGELPRLRTLDLAAYYETSRRAGGDYYDVFDLGGGRWGVMIADVSGHSTPAAVIMAVTHAVAHLHPGRGVPPGELLAFVNRRLAERYTLGTGAFVTAFYGIYDDATRTLTYASAGHNPPRLVRGGRVSSLAGARGIPLGIDADQAYPEDVEALEPGDVLLLYTDGLSEARSPTGEMYGDARMDQALLDRVAASAEQGATAAGVLDTLLADLRVFTDGAAAADDRTVVAGVAR